MPGIGTTYKYDPSKPLDLFSDPNVGYGTLYKDEIEYALANYEAQPPPGQRTYFGESGKSFYTEGGGGRFLSAKDIEYAVPGSVAKFYGITTDNIFASGQFFNKFQTDAVQKGITSGGNAGILADLRSNKNVLGNNPAQAALLRQYLDTGVVPAGLDAQFAINAYDYAIREQGRKQQNKPPSFLQSAAPHAVRSHW